MRLPRVLIIAVVFVVGCADASARAQCVVPNTISNGQTADASQVMGNFTALNNCINSAPAGSANAVQVNGGSGTFAGVGPLTNGQLVIGSTGAAPQPATLTAGSGISITNAPGAITIAATGGGGGGGATYTPPVLSAFTYANQPTGATATSIAGGIQLYSPTEGGNFNLNLLLQPLPTPPYTMWMRVSSSVAPGSSISEYGIALGAITGKLVDLVFLTGAPSGGNWNIQYETYNSYTSRNSNTILIQNPTVPPLLGIYDDGTNLHLMISYDGVSAFTIYTVSRTAWLTTGPTQIGFFNNAYSTATTVNVVHWAPNLPGPM